MRQHLKENGEPGKCSAKPGNCPLGPDQPHFETASELREFYEKEQELIYAMDNVKAKPKNPATVQALSSSLKYKGKKPRWFKKLPTAAFQKNVLGFEPEIIDVIDSPLGKLAVVWEENSAEEVDVSIVMERGYSIPRITYRKLGDGEIVAYIKGAYIDEESANFSYGNDENKCFRYLADTKSFYGMEKEYSDSEIYKVGDTKWEAIRTVKMPDLNDRQKKEKFVSYLKRTVSGGLCSYENEMSSKTDEELEEEFQRLKKESLVMYETNIKNSSTPTIDFSRIRKPELKGIGLGHSMYVYLGRKLAEKNLPLRASGLQSNEAQKTWSLMGADKDFPISVQTRSYEDSRGNKTYNPSYVLDFRNYKPAEKKYAMKLTEDDLFTI